MARKKKKKKDLSAEQSAAEPEQPQAKPEGTQCPMCEKDIPEGKHYYCPHCGREIDYLLWAGITPDQEQKKDIEKNAAKLLYPFFVVGGVYVVVWLCLYGVILRKCMTAFMGQRPLD